MEIPKNIQTPIFLFEKKKIIERYKELKETFEKAINKEVTISYSVKSNHDEKILKILAKEKSFFSVSSINELKKVLKITKKENIEYYNQSMDEKDYKKIISLGVKNITVDSNEQLQFVKGKASIRLKPINVDNALFGTSEFGVKDVKELKKVVGVNCHIASQNTELKAWKHNFMNIKEKISKWQKKGLKLKKLNLGGGFPVTYNKKTPSIKEIANSISKEIKEIIKLYPYVEIILEPGRYLVGDGALVTKVKLIKGNIVFVDASVYSSYMDTLGIGLKLNVRSLKKGKKKLYTIRGNTPCTLDIFNKVSIPEVKVGDFIIFENAGAYNIASDFCSHDKPRTLIN